MTRKRPYGNTANCIKQLCRYRCPFIFVDRNRQEHSHQVQLVWKEPILVPETRLTWSHGNVWVGPADVDVWLVVSPCCLLWAWRMRAVANLLPHSVHMWTRGVEWIRQWAFNAVHIISRTLVFFTKYQEYWIQSKFLRCSFWHIDRGFAAKKM